MFWSRGGVIKTVSLWCNVDDINSWSEQRFLPGTQTPADGKRDRESDRDRLREREGPLGPQILHCLYRLTLKRKSPSLLLIYIVAQNKVVTDSKGGCYPNEATFAYLLTSAFLLKNVMWAANHLNTTLKLQSFSFIWELGQLQHFGFRS